jgi:hypothetical protein
VGGRGVLPPRTSTPEGSTPQGEEKTTEHEQVAVGDAIGMMRYFQRMSEALINCLDRDEGRESIPNEGLKHPPVASGSVHREPEKVKIPKFWGSKDGLAVKACLDNMAMCFALHYYTSNMKVRMVIFQLKGSALLWWKTLLPKLNMDVEDISWDLFEEKFQERYLYDDFIELQLNELNTLR